MPGWFPTPSEIAAVLADGPRPRSITLIEVRVAPNYHPILDSVALDDLEVLTPEAAFSGHLWEVLSLITGTSNLIRLSVSMGDDYYIPAIHLLSKRCKLLMLHLRAGDPGELGIPAILVLMPYLLDLVLKYVLLTGNAARDVLFDQSPNIRPSAHCPALRRIFLIGCSPTEDILSELVTLLQPSQTLILYNGDQTPASHI